MKAEERLHHRLLITRATSIDLHLFQVYPVADVKVCHIVTRRRRIVVFLITSMTRNLKKKNINALSELILMICCQEHKTDYLITTVYVDP